MLVAAMVLVLGCKAKKDEGGAPAEPPKDRPAITQPWSDSFDRAELGDDYYATSEGYQIKDGALTVRGAFNHPLWLRKPLPRDVVIELDVKSSSAAGDIKVEAFGDGRSHATTKGAYTATGYVFVFGGWSNSKSILARRNEHGKELAVDKTRRKVVKGQKYHWKITRKGSRVEWQIDGAPFLVYDDPRPLAGEGHQYFGFNNWKSDLWFDNLKIAPL
jgi:hypothetical protein